MVTISDLAKITGYSVSTVTRVLSHNGAANQEAEERILLAARLDNLGKGASGAALQCFNLMTGAPEETGLV